MLVGTSRLDVMDGLDGASGIEIGANGHLISMGIGSLTTPHPMGVLDLSAPVANGSDLWLVAIPKTKDTLARHRRVLVSYVVDACMPPGSLLIGSLPGIQAGARLNRTLPEKEPCGPLYLSLLTAGLRVTHRSRCIHSRQRDLLQTSCL